jgi:hypothetical protein
MFTLHGTLSGQNSRLATASAGGRGRASCLLVAALLLSTSLAGCKKKTPNPEATPASSSPGDSGSSSPGTSSAPKDTHISDTSEQALGKDQGGSLADRLNAVQSGDADKPGNRPPPDLKPYPARPAQWHHQPVWSLLR